MCAIALFAQIFSLEENDHEAMHSIPRYIIYADRMVVDRIRAGLERQRQIPTLAREADALCQDH
ncbi:hypothetical protein BTW07_08655 [Salinicola socius]|uniref:Uncharacterized protein n=1 Tax=Salinicola socius TaxID=404433 RepID=A0A1Q8SST2_9GAMM|nr:hypothetical protein BTW07_08655 [Salinicola socius]